MKQRLRFSVILLMVLAAGPVSAADVLERFQKKIDRFTLDNGMTFLVAERNRAPVISFVAFVNVGGVNEPEGHTGMAHFLEHMAFKGTPDIGTTNRQAEKALLEKVDRAYADWLHAKYKSKPGGDENIKSLRREFIRLRDEAEQYVVPNAYAKILERNGAADLNAATSKDYTMYFCSLPSNRIELWFNLESARLENPVFRQFYKEKQVVLEERRMRIDSDPTGRMMEELQALAYLAHPYGRPTIGWTTDIVATTRPDMKAFYRRHYYPANITVAVVGDATPDRVRKLAETYFGPMKKQQAETDIVTREPEQQSRRRFTQTGPNQPLYMEAYHSVDQLHEDAMALEILADILARGRVSRLHEQLVVQQGLAQTIQVSDGFPGDLYSGLFMIYAVPRKDASLDNLAAGLHREISKIAEEGVDQDELDRATTRIRADRIRSLQSNLGLAWKLAEAEAQKGGWRRVFTDLKHYREVTAEDVRSVAEAYLVENNRTEGRLLLQEKGKGEK